MRADGIVVMPPGCRRLARESRLIFASGGRGDGICADRCSVVREKERDEPSSVGASLQVVRDKVTNAAAQGLSKNPAGGGHPVCADPPEAPTTVSVSVVARRHDRYRYPGLIALGHDPPRAIVKS